MWYLAAAGMAIAFIIGLKYRNDSGVYVAMAGILLCAVLMAFSGCAAKPPPAPAPVPVAVATPAPVIPPDPYASLPPDEAQAIKQNQTPTLHHGITWVEPYSPDLQYPLHCRALRVTQIRLRPDERTDKDNVKVGDKDRWGTIVGEHSVLIFPLGSNTSITVPGAQLTIPADPHMATNLIIHTTLTKGEPGSGNDYVFNPVDMKGSYTEAMEFYYPDWVRAQAATREAALKQQER